LAQNIHNSIVQKIHALWSPRDAGLLDAMVIGDDAFLNYDTRVDFQRSGTYHILVVSGLNLIILAFVDSGPFDDCGRMKSSPAITVLLSWFYAFLTDLGAPIWRAVLMLTIFLASGSSTVIDRF
jgi:competence protein ComEC